VSFAGRALEVIYRHPGRLAPAGCGIEAITIGGAALPFDREGPGVRIRRAAIAALPEDVQHQLIVSLSAGPN
jgi:hypothetical protein